MAIRERKVKNKRNSQGILTGRPGIVYDGNVKVYENGKQKSIAKRGFATRREAELYEAQIKLELQTGSAAMVGYGPESKQRVSAKMVRELPPQPCKKYAVQLWK